jgi:hypothetical protein
MKGRFLFRKAEAAEFRLKAADVLWATAKCRHPSSPDAHWRAREEAQTKLCLVLRRLLKEVDSMCRRRSVDSK